MKLYTYFQSSASYRVRIALNLKEIQAEMAFVDLTKGEQKQAAYAALNPQMAVPSLVEGGHTLTQSLAIMEYLDELYPQHPLLPRAPLERARVRALALAIACEISPLNNLKVRKYLSDSLAISEEARTDWIRHWIADGFASLEKMLAESPATGHYCHGDLPGMADCCLVPQVFNARRFECDLSPYPTIARIDEACNRLPAFIAALPKNQPDAK